MGRLIHNTGELRNRRRELRKVSTKAEELLWNELRGNKLGFRFRRQYSIGGYILDFYCPRQRLIVELDGAIHDFNKEYDAKRNLYFKELDYTVLRFKNEEIERDMSQVVEKIKQNFHPSPKSRRGVRGEDA